MKRVIDVSDTLYKTCNRLVSEGDARPSECCVANSEPYEPIDEITEEQAIDVLHHYGWLVVRNEHKAVERPKCVWREATRKNMFDEEVKCFECSNCHKTEIMNVIIHKKLPFCPNCGAEMGGTT